MARAQVPASVAHVLANEPQLAAAAVRAFYHRGPQDMRAAARMATFPPKVGSCRGRSCSRPGLPGDSSYLGLLAGSGAGERAAEQVSLQPAGLPADGSTKGKAQGTGLLCPLPWAGSRCTRPCRQGYPPLPPPDHPRRRAAALGLKLSMGLEMIHAARPRVGVGAEIYPAGEAGPPGPARPPTSDRDLAGAWSSLDPLWVGQRLNGVVPCPRAAGDPAWRSFRRALERSGYFAGELEGSARHRRLMAEAVRAYADSEAFLRSNRALAEPAQRIDQLLQASLLLRFDGRGPVAASAEPPLPWCVQAPVDPASFPPEGELPPESDDSWLEAAGAQLEQELQLREAELEAAASRKAARRQKEKEFDPADLLQGMQVSGGGEVGILPAEPASHSPPFPPSCRPFSSSRRGWRAWTFRTRARGSPSTLPAS